MLILFAYVHFNSKLAEFLDFLTGDLDCDYSNYIVTLHITLIIELYIQ